jgi:probable HAF family extracellular repeat protein
MKSNICVSNKHHLATIFGAMALTACLAIGVSSTGAQTYDVNVMGILPGKKVCTPTAINNAGQVTGTASAGTEETAFLYYSEDGQGEMEDIGPAGSISRAFGINDSGDAVGDSTFGGGISIRHPARHAAIFRDGSSADLGTLKSGGPFSRANGINTLGQVVGFASQNLDSGASRAFIWSKSTGMLDLGTLGGTYAMAFGINDSGFVTGTSQIADGKLGATHAFIYQPFSFTERFTQAMRDLGTLGGSYSYGTFINATNHVVGHSTLIDGRFHAFLHDGMKMHDLGSLGFNEAGGVDDSLKTDQSFALGVNNTDQVVGYTFLPYQDDSGVFGSPVQVAFIYSNGVMTDLNTLIGPAAKYYQLYSATAINDKGQIAVSAFDYDNNVFRALLLTPAP